MQTSIGECHCPKIIGVIPAERVPRNRENDHNQDPPGKERFARSRNFAIFHELLHWLIGQSNNLMMDNNNENLTISNLIFLLKGEIFLIKVYIKGGYWLYRAHAVAGHFIFVLSCERFQHPHGEAKRGLSAGWK
jgi:hypothetical protein